MKIREIVRNDETRWDRECGRQSAPWEEILMEQTDGALKELKQSFETFKRDYDIKDTGARVQEGCHR